LELLERPRCLVEARLGRQWALYTVMMRRLLGTFEFEELT
jgi:hypothetical protein